MFGMWAWCLATLKDLCAPNILSCFSYNPRLLSVGQVDGGLSSCDDQRRAQADYYPASILAAMKGVADKLKSKDKPPHVT